MRLGEVAFPSFFCADAYLINARRNVSYDRIYIAAGAPRSALAHFSRLLRPGGVLIGPFGDTLLKVTKPGLAARREAKAKQANHRWRRRRVSSTSSLSLSSSSPRSDLGDDDNDNDDDNNGNTNDEDMGEDSFSNGSGGRAQSWRLPSQQHRRRHRFSSSSGGHTTGRKRRRRRTPATTMRRWRGGRGPAADDHPRTRVLRAARGPQRHGEREGAHHGARRRSVDPTDPGLLPGAPELPACPRCPACCGGLSSTAEWAPEAVIKSAAAAAATVVSAYRVRVQ